MKDYLERETHLKSLCFAGVLMIPFLLPGQQKPEDTELQTEAGHDERQTDWIGTQVEPIQEGGYFPTVVDIEHMPHADHRRFGGSRHNGPDHILEHATGTFPYPRNDSVFYSQHRNAFDPANRVLNVFTPHDPLLAEFPGITNGGLTANVSLPIFTRELEPDLAHLKLGPLYFDLLWVGAGALWTDYSPKGNTRPVEGDDVAAYIDFAIRGYVRITDTIYFSMYGNFMYLPLENEFAVRALAGSRAGAFAQFVLQERIGTWDLVLMDTLRLSPGLDIYADIDNEGVDTAGRYRFGFYDRDDPSRFDFEEEHLWISNQLLGRASTLFFSEDWRLWLQADHTDFWHTFDFEDHAYRDHFGASLGYEGDVIPFSPLLSYDVTTNDHDSYRHSASLRFTGRLTENIQTRFGGGYLWVTGDDNNRERWIWNVSLHHRITEGIGHGVAFGQNAFDDEYTPETVWATYARYWINAKITDRISLGAYGQWEESERWNRRDNRYFDTDEFERYSAGAILSFRPLDYTNVTARAVYQNTEVPGADRDMERWIYRLNITQRLASRLTGEAYYQYEESRHQNGGFDEHLLGFSIKHYF